MDIITDRRIKPRITCDYPAIIKGSDIRGNKYQENGKLANLSASGLYLWVNRNIEPGSKITITVLLSSTDMNKKAHSLSANGIVVRSEPQTDDAWGVAVKFTGYRFH